jgi:hypothetical protein
MLGRHPYRAGTTMDGVVDEARLLPTARVPLPGAEPDDAPRRAALLDLELAYVCRVLAVRGVGWVVRLPWRPLGTVELNAAAGAVEREGRG